jgi:hypothetical protein
MLSQLPPLNALRAFEAAARSESFTQAAHCLAGKQSHSPLLPPSPFHRSSRQIESPADAGSTTLPGLPLRKFLDHQVTKLCAGLEVMSL